MSPAADQARPWRLALVWLLVLGPSFFFLYGLTNHYAASLPPERVGNIALAWERSIPLWPWTIVPYWSIDLLYGFSLFLCSRREELNTHAKRLLCVTVLSCACFVLFPLRFTFERPPLEGVFGQLFTLLMGFDKPFNQAPSLHIGLLTVLWLRYWAHVPRIWHGLLHGWFVLIGLSVLTTWQHHFLDIPTGFALGLLVCYLLPMPESGWPRWQAYDSHHSRRLALRYGVPGLALAVAAWGLGGWGCLLLWPGVALLLVALGYGGVGPAVMQKHAGRRRFAAQVLLWPYRLVVGAVHRHYLRRLPGVQEVADGVWVGPVTAAGDPRFGSVLDLAAEYDRQAPATTPYRSCPLLDLLVPNASELHTCVAALETLRQAHQGPLLVHCALGLTRSAMVVLAWMVATGRAATLEQALQQFSLRRADVKLSERQRLALAPLCKGMRAI